MLTLRARLFLAASPDLEGNSPEDVAYSIFKEWAFRCLDLAQWDYPSDDIQRDDSFSHYMGDAEKLMEFANGMLDAYPDTDREKTLKLVHSYSNKAPESPVES